MKAETEGRSVDSVLSEMETVDGVAEGIIGIITVETGFRNFGEAKMRCPDPERPDINLAGEDDWRESAFMSLSESKSAWNVWTRREPFPDNLIPAEVRDAEQL